MSGVPAAAAASRDFRYAQGLVAAVVGDRGGQAHLHADEDVAIRLDAGSAISGVDELRRLQLPGRVLVRCPTDGEAGPRYVEKRQDPGAEALHRKGPEAGEGVAAGAAGVDGRGDPAPETVVIGVDAERGHQVVGVGVQIRPSPESRACRRHRRCCGRSRCPGWHRPRRSCPWRSPHRRGRPPRWPGRSPAAPDQPVEVPAHCSVQRMA